MWISGGFRGFHPQNAIKAVDNSAELGSEVVRQLFPSSIRGSDLSDIDPLDIYPRDTRAAPADRPWLLINMIASVDGATAVDGLSGGLGGEADKLVFRAIRASCDWILVASATAAAETYRIPRSDSAVAALRVAAGRSAAPRLAIVTASGRVDPTIPAFTERDAKEQAPLVIAGTDADETSLGKLDAEVIRVASPTPDALSVLHDLKQRGAAVVLSEGGPTWNGHLSAAGVVDEICLTMAPTLAGGTSSRIVAGAVDSVARDLSLERLLESDGFIFARYVRRG